MFGWLKNLFKKEKPIVKQKQVKAFNFDRLDPVDEYEWRNQHDEKKNKNSG
jgi:hypothetical protein